MLEKQVLTQWKITSTASAVKGNVVHLANEETWQWRIELLDIATGKKLPAQPFLDLNFNFNAIAFSVDHRILVSQPTYPGSDLRDSPISLWETSTGHKLSSFDLPAIAGGNPGERPKFDKLVGISPNGRLIATCNPETFTISLWEHVSGKARWHLPMPAGCKSIPTVAFSPDSSRLATGCSIGPQEKKSIHVWDLTTGQECQCFHGHRSGSKGDPPNIVFSPDGRRLASAGLDYTVLIWGVKQTPSLEKASQPLDQKELQVLKSALGCLDAVTAYRAIGKLRQVPDQAVSLAAECLRPQIPSPQTERIAREVNLLIGELDSNDFQSRMEALEKLRKTLSTEDEPIAQSMLSQTLLEGKLSVEVRKSVTKLLAELTDERKLGGVKTLELLRMFRAIELLESIHNKSAREVLQKVVTASPRPEVGQEAETALKRLSRTPYTAMP